VNYLMKITHIRDQRVAIKEKVEDVELVNVALRGLPRSWEPFVQGICARETLPGFDRLWSECIQEETRLESRNGLVESNSDENQTLAAHTRKGKRGSLGRWSSREREASPELRRKKDLNKIISLNVMIMVTMLHSVHTGREWEEGSRH
jgi:hypothetical protein